jgi:hypothetical protein
MAMVRSTWAGEPAGAFATRRERVRFAGAGSPASAGTAASTPAATSAASVLVAAGAASSAAGGEPVAALADRRALVRFAGAGDSPAWTAATPGATGAATGGSAEASAAT